MHKNDERYKMQLAILRKELQPALGCTEPAALAYAAALAATYCEGPIKRIKVVCSTNILKNIKSVTIPNLGNLKGVEASVAAGIISGMPEKELEIFKYLPERKEELIEQFLQDVVIDVQLSTTDTPFEIVINLFSASHSAEVKIVDEHTNVVFIKQNDTVVFDQKDRDSQSEDELQYGLLDLQSIFDFVESVDLTDISDILDLQITYNMAIAGEGLHNEYGVSIGSMLLNNHSSVQNELKAFAAAGSDARMGGCEKPVIINSGSGNQGITVSVPVIRYTQIHEIEKDRLQKALLISNLIAIYQRHGIGSLSAYCGVINAGIAAVCGIAFLEHKSLDAISHTLENGLAIASGVICDGAKASCAAKIVLGIDSGFLGYEMFKNNKNFLSGDGIVKENADATVATVARLGRYGMREVGNEISRIMLEK